MPGELATITKEQIQTALDEVFTNPGLADNVVAQFVERLGNKDDVAERIIYQTLFAQVAALALSRLEISNQFEIGGFTFFNAGKFPRVARELKFAMEEVCRKGIDFMPKILSMADRPAEEIVKVLNVPLPEISDDIAKSSTPPDLTFAIRLLEPLRGSIKASLIVGVNLNYPSRLH